MKLEAEVRAVILRRALLGCSEKPLSNVYVYVHILVCIIGTGWVAAGRFPVPGL